MLPIEIHTVPPSIRPPSITSTSASSSTVVTDIQPQIDNSGGYNSNANGGHIIPINPVDIHDSRDTNGGGGGGGDRRFPIEASGYENHFLSPPTTTTPFGSSSTNAQLVLPSRDIVDNGNNRYPLLHANRARSRSAASPTVRSNAMLRNVRSSKKNNSTNDSDRTLDVAASEMLVFDVDEAIVTVDDRPTSRSTDDIDNGNCINVWIVLIASIGIGIAVTMLMLLQRRHFYRKLSESIVHVYSA